MLEFLSLEPKTFGLDVSDLSLKLIKLKRKRGVLTLASFGETPIKPGIIKKGEIKDEKSLVEIIKKAVARVNGEKIISRHIIASLPEEKAFLQVIKMPLMKKESLKKAVYFEAENHIPLPINDVYLDSQIISPLPSARNNLEVLIAALPKALIDSYVSLFQRAGLIPLALEIESQAICRALIKDEAAQGPLLLIDLGVSRTSFIIFNNGSLRFTSSVSAFSDNFTESIARSLGKSLEEAEKLKLKYGIQKKKKWEEVEGEKVFEAIKPVLSELKEQAKKHIRYGQSLSGNKNIGKIILCGGGANLKGLADFLSLEMKLPVEVGNPWKNVGPNPSELPLQESLKYTTAIGLALRGVHPVK